jgi:hypothetical protein
MTTTALTVLTPPDPLAFVRPTRRTLFWRTFLIWQLIRFVVINLRITVMIVKSHGTRIR